MTVTTAGSTPASARKSHAGPIENADGHAPAGCMSGPGGRGPTVWQIAADDEKWAFEGSPLVDGTDVYVAMRKSDVRPQVHVACFDAETAIAAGGP